MWPVFRTSPYRAEAARRAAGGSTTRILFVDEGQGCRQAHTCAAPACGLLWCCRPDQSCRVAGRCWRRLCWRRCWRAAATRWMSALPPPPWGRHPQVLPSAYAEQFKVPTPLDVASPGHRAGCPRACLTMLCR